MAIESNQITALGRYLGSGAASAFTVLGVLAIIPQDQAQELIKQLHVLQDAIQQAVGAIGKMWIILGPLAFAMLAKMGMNASSVKGMLGNLFKIATTGNAIESAQAQTGMVTATAQVVTADPAKTSASLTAEVKTQLASATVELAKNSQTTTVALLDRVTELPQVNAILTDAATANNTQSPLVKAGAS